MAFASRSGAFASKHLTLKIKKITDIFFSIKIAMKGNYDDIFLHTFYPAGIGNDGYVIPIKCQG